MTDSNNMLCCNWAVGRDDRFCCIFVLYNNNDDDDDDDYLVYIVIQTEFNSLQIWRGKIKDELPLRLMGITYTNRETL